MGRKTGALIAAAGLLAAAEGAAAEKTPANADSDWRAASRFAASWPDGTSTGVDLPEPIPGAIALWRTAEPALADPSADSVEMRLSYDADLPASLGLSVGPRAALSTKDEGAATAELGMAVAVRIGKSVTLDASSAALREQSATGAEQPETSWISGIRLGVDF